MCWSVTTRRRRKGWFFCKDLVKIEHTCILLSMLRAAPLNNSYPCPSRALYHLSTSSLTAQQSSSLVVIHTGTQLTALSSLLHTHAHTHTYTEEEESKMYRLTDREINLETAEMDIVGHADGHIPGRDRRSFDGLMAQEGSLATGAESLDSSSSAGSGADEEAPLSKTVSMCVCV